MATIVEKLSLEMSVTRAHMYLSTCIIAEQELRESDPLTAQMLRDITDVLKTAICRINYPDTL